VATGYEGRAKRRMAEGSFEMRANPGVHTRKTPICDCAGLQVGVAFASGCVPMFSLRALNPKKHTELIPQIMEDRP